MVERKTGGQKMTKLKKAIEDFVGYEGFGNKHFRKKLNDLIELAFEEQKSMIINELSKKLKWIEIHPKIIKCIENAPSTNQEDK